MADLPPRADLDQLRQRANDLLKAAKRGDADALARLHAVSGQLILDSAQLALAREHGFASWAKLKTEIDRRNILDSTEVTRLNALLAEHPELAVEEMRNWCDHPGGPSPLTTAVGSLGHLVPSWPWFLFRPPVRDPCHKRIA